MKKKDINIVLTTMALFMLFKTLFKGDTPLEMDEMKAADNGDSASDVEYDLLNNRVLKERYEDDEPEEKDFVEWLQTALDGLAKMAKVEETSEAMEEEEVVEAESVSDD